jgi:hypothetical protein
VKRLDNAVEMLFDLPSVIDTLTQGTETDRYAVVLDKCRALVGGHCGALALKDDSGTWNVSASSSPLVRQLQHSRVSRGLSAACRVESVGGPVAIDIDPLDGAFDGSVTELFNHGYRFEYAFPLNGVDSLLGAVILLDGKDRPLADDDMRLVQVAVDVMGRALSCLREKDAFNRQVAQLSSALESRIVIEQAKGVIAARSGVDVGEAFLVLRRTARDARESVADVAARIVGGAAPV